MMQELKEQLLAEVAKCRHRKELSKTVGPDYFEPGMMEHLEQSEGCYDPQTNQILIRFDARGTRYEGRTELIEKVKLGDVIRVVRQMDNAYNPDHFDLLTESGKSVGTLPAELSHVMAPLFDAGLLTWQMGRVSYVEPISKRSRHAKQAVLFVELQMQLL